MSITTFLADNLLEGSPELIEIGNLFRKLGQSNSAASCFIKAGRADLACEAAIELNDWSQAVEIGMVAKLRLAWLANSFSRSCLQL